MAITLRGTLVGETAATPIMEQNGLHLRRDGAYLGSSGRADHEKDSGNDDPGRDSEKDETGRGAGLDDSGRDSG